MDKDGIIFFGIIIIGIVSFAYTQRYTKNNDETATKGIIFQKTVLLKEYKKVSQGRGAFGLYDGYSRSDRHETITVYR